MMRLVASQLACSRGFREILENINFQLSAGQALAVTGANGAGKSSLLRLLAGLLRPSGGGIVLEGGAADLSVPEQAHYLAHQDAFKGALTVTENLQFWATYLGSGRAAIREALAAVGLEGLADLPAAYLSAGQRRRLSIARLVAIERAIWLLDEPASALDTAGQARLGALMQAHLRSGGLIVAATHGPLGIEPVQELRLGAS
jgi:heme exporter protein A